MGYSLYPLWDISCIPHGTWPASYDHYARGADAAPHRKGIPHEGGRMTEAASHDRSRRGSMDSGLTGLTRRRRGGRALADGNCSRFWGRNGKTREVKTGRNRFFEARGGGELPEGALPVHHADRA
jgi:hypothetical protein